jgi:hypothetical protein
MIKIRRGGDGWVVVGTSVLSTSQDLEQAVLAALLLADLHGTPLELDSDVREAVQQVLERAQQRRAKLEAARHATELAVELERARRNAACG